MTNKRYPKSARPSRSPRPAGRAPYPFARRYDALPDAELDPLLGTIDAIPEIRRLDRRLVRLSKRVQGDVRDVPRYVAFEDLRVEQRLLREAAFYDAGHQHGRTEGASEASAVDADRKAAAFGRLILAARLASKLTATQAVAVLLQITRGLVVGEQLSGR